MMRANTKQAISDSTQALLFTANENPDTFGKLVFGGELNLTERMRVYIFIRATLRGFETQLFHYKSGLLDEEEWQTLQNTIHTTMAYPGAVEVWPELRDVISPELRDLIDKGKSDDA
ncbi:MAG: hypothetical protein GKR90_17705 [Pseudomonadales bacterium]|nr:hypothetical protein [Pseudomonadales bacterium]